MKDHPRTAREFYQEAAEVLGREPAVTDSRDLMLDSPVPLLLPIPTSSLRHRELLPHEVKERVVVVGFEVGRDGDPDDPEVIESEGSYSHDDEAVAAIHSARFRPRFVAGVPVVAKNVTHQFVFRSPK